MGILVRGFGIRTDTSSSRIQQSAQYIIITDTGTSYAVSCCVQGRSNDFRKSHAHNLARAHFIEGSNSA